jgi:hypothetical protein
MLAAGTIAGPSHPAAAAGGGAPLCCLRLIAIPRAKFALPCTQGWTLANPIASTTARDMFQLPLDQGYAFPYPDVVIGVDPPARRRPSSGPSLFANECAVKSTLVLPLAMVCSCLFAAAASRSDYNSMKWGGK